MVNRGSEWRRWDPHIHAPGTVLNNQFKGPDAWSDYLTVLETATPAIEAIAVTDLTGGPRSAISRSANTLHVASRTRASGAAAQGLRIGASWADQCQRLACEIRFSIHPWRQGTPQASTRHRQCR